MYIFMLMEIKFDDNDNDDDDDIFFFHSDLNEEPLNQNEVYTGYSNTFLTVSLSCNDFSPLKQANQCRSPLKQIKMPYVNYWGQ